MTPKTLKINGVTAFSRPVEIDLGSLPSGLICVVGPNGAGKTTIMECMAPGAMYRELPSRPSRRGLLEYATHRQAYVDLTMDYQGHEIRLLHQLDPAYSNGRGKAESFVFVDGESMVAGRSGDFDELVATLLPSRAVFLASAYAAQNKAGNFTAMPQAKRRELFAELLGLGELQTLALRAREHRKICDAGVGEMERRAERLDLDAARHAELTEAHATATKALQTTTHSGSGLQRKLNTAVQELATSRATADAAEKHRNRASFRRTELAAKVNRHEADCKGALVEITSLHRLTAPEHVAGIEAAVAKLRTLEASRTELLAEWREVDAITKTKAAGCDRLRREMITRVAGVKQLEAELDRLDPVAVVTDADLEQAGHALARAEQARAEQRVPPSMRHPDTVRNERERAQSDAELIDAVPCEGERVAVMRPTDDHGSDHVRDCGACPLLTTAVQAKATLPELTAELAVVEAAHLAAVQAEAELRIAQATLGGMEAQRRNAEAYTRCMDQIAGAIGSRDLTRQQIRDLDAEIAICGKRRLQITIEGEAMAAKIAELGDPSSAQRGVDAAAARLPDVEARAAQAKRSRDEAAHDLAELPEPQDLDPILADAVEAASHRAHQADKALQEYLAQVRTQTSECDRLAGQLEHLGDVKAKRDDLAKAATRYGLRRRGFALVEQAVGREGIQALEIDAAGPEVSLLATQLLCEAAGARFSVELRTISEAEGNRKAREVFDLLVYDGKSAGSRSFDDLSGGEQTLIDEALKLAIAVFNARRHGAIKTLWRDEADGRLDPERRAMYPAMLRAALDLGDFDRLFYVSHDPVVQAQADARILVANGGVTVEV